VPQAFRQEWVTERGGISNHDSTGDMQGMVPIPDAQGRGAPQPCISRQAQGRQQLGKNSIGVGGLAADKGAHPNAVAPLPRECPAEAMPNKTEFEAGGLRIDHRCIHFRRHGSREAGPRWAESQGR